jgi:hypothetical protein
MLTKAFQGKWQLLMIAAAVVLALSNPSPGDFERYLRNRLHDPTEHILQIDRWLGSLIGKYQIHRRNLLLFSIYDVSYQSILSKENGSQVVLGIGSFFIPLYQTPPGVAPWWQGREMGYLRL